MDKTPPIKDIDKLNNLGNLLKKSSYRNYMLFSIILNSGMLPSETINLKVKAVRGAKEIVVPGRTGHEKKYPVTNTLSNDIEFYTNGMNDEEYLFPAKGSAGTKPIGRLMARHIIMTAAEKVGLSNISCETLRKTFGYHYYMNNHDDLSYLRKLYNHASNKITENYIGVVTNNNE